MHCAQTSKPFSRTPKLSLSQTLRSLPQTAPRLPSACYHAAVDSPFVLLRPPTTHGAPVPRCTSTMPALTIIRPPPCLEWLLAVPVGHYWGISLPFPLNPRSAHRSGRNVLSRYSPCFHRARLPTASCASWLNAANQQSSCYLLHTELLNCSRDNHVIAVARYT